MYLSKQQMTLLRFFKASITNNVLQKISSHFNDLIVNSKSKILEHAKSKTQTRYLKPMQEHTNYNTETVNKHNQMEDCNTALNINIINILFRFYQNFETKEIIHGVALAAARNKKEF